jgi:hypothetical protein
MIVTSQVKNDNINLPITNGNEVRWPSFVVVATAVSFSVAKIFIRISTLAVSNLLAHLIGD